MGALGRLLLGAGTVPPELRSALEAEGVVHLEEGLRGSVTYRNFRAPGRRAALRRVGLMGALAVTRQRLVVLGRSGPVIDVGWDQPQVHALDVSVDDGRLLVAFDPAAFHADQSGRIEVRLRGADPASVAATIDELRRPAP